MKTVTVYVDGACAVTRGVGGWGAVLEHAGRVKEFSGNKPADATNNQMELTACIEGLRVLKEPCAVILFTDSEYVRKGITEWIVKWKAANWRTSDKKPVKNKELWEQLERETLRHGIEWRWVRGHSGDALNERANEIAQRQAGTWQQ